MAASDTEELQRDPYRGTLNWILVFVALIQAILHFFFVFQSPANARFSAAPSLILGIGLVALIVVFFTDYWRPALYIVMALFGSYVTSTWIFAIPEFTPLSLANGITALILFLLGVFLFYRERVHHVT